MASYTEKASLKSEFEGAVNITDKIQEIVAKSGIKSGL